MDPKLYEAALRGRVDTLVELLDQDPSILDRVDAAVDTPLHLATSLGHLSFCDKILRRKPEFAQVLNGRQKSLPLHLACRKGELEMVAKLLMVNPEGCLVRDGQGLTPGQIAAVKGRAEVLSALIKARPSGVQILTDRGETLLHLCVKHNRLQALKQLLNAGGDVVIREIINFRDEGDNTILHLAVARKNAEMVKLLVRRNYQMDVKATNLDGLTALDMLSYEPSTGIEKSIEKLLRKAGVKRSAMAKKQQAQLSRQKKRQKHEDWLMNTKGSLMIVAILIATVTYQAGLSPPGGFLQMDAGNKTSSANPPLSVPQMLSTMHPGVAVMAITNELAYKVFIIVNTAGFLSSLCIILMLVSGFPLDGKLFVWVLMVVTWIAIISMAFTYGIALAYTSINFPYGSTISIGGLLLMAVFLLLGHLIRFLVRLTRWLLTMLGSILGRLRAAHGSQRIAV